jgi:response regulator of citrate/malate metabolism
VFATYTSAGFSAEEVGELIGASRSTARRYLEYMTTTGEVYADVVYGSVGRPERHYFAQR